MQLPSTEMEEAGQGEDILGESGMVGDHGNGISTVRLNELTKELWKMYERGAWKGDWRLIN